MGIRTDTESLRLEGCCSRNVVAIAFLTTISVALHANVIANYPQDVVIKRSFAELS